MRDELQKDHIAGASTGVAAADPDAVGACEVGPATGACVVGDAVWAARLNTDDAVALDPSS